MDFSSLDHGKEMLEYTSEKCSKTLKFLKLGDTFKDVLDGLKNPFINVKELKFRNSIIFGSSTDIQAKMSVSFPNVDSVELDSVTVASWGFVYGSLPKLKSLIIRSLWASEVNGVDESHYAELFKINQQIESVDVSNCNYIFVKVVADHLPNLKVLKLYKPEIMKYKVDPVHLKTVNEFELFLKEPQDGLLDKIVFDSKLE